MSNLSAALAGTIAYSSETSSAQAWFAGGERAGYDPKARVIVPAQGAPLNVFLRGEGDLARLLIDVITSGCRLTGTYGTVCDLP